MPPTITPLLQPAIHPMAYGRNGMIISPQAINPLITGTNQVLKYRTKELAYFSGDLQHITAASAILYRSRSRTGPWCAGIRWSMLIAKSPENDDPYATMGFYNSAGTLVDSVTAHYGSATGTPNVTPDEWKLHEGVIDYDPLQDVEIRVTTFNTCRVIGAHAFEQAKKTSVANGYLMPVQNTGPVYDSQRDAMAAALEDMLLEGAAHVFSTTGQTATATATNILDGTSTTITAATPGFTLDMQYKARKSQAATGVLVTAYAYGITPTAADGFIEFKNSAGTVLGTISGFTTAGGWRTTTFLLPASSGKIDIHLRRTTNNTVVSAVSVFELG